MSAQITYRTGTGIDVLHLGLLWRDFYEHLAKCGQAAPTADGFPEWARPVSALVDMGKLHLELAEDGDDRVGYALSTLEPVPTYLVDRGQNIGFIKELYAVPSHRGQGIARGLIERTRLWCLEHKVKKLELGVLARNTDAREAYRKLGWTEAALTLTRPV